MTQERTPIVFEGDVDEAEIAARQRSLGALLFGHAQPSERSVVAVPLSSGMEIELPLPDEHTADFRLTDTEPVHLVEAMRTTGHWWDHGPADLSGLLDLLNCERASATDLRAERAEIQDRLNKILTGIAAAQGVLGEAIT